MFFSIGVFLYFSGCTHTETWVENPKGISWGSGKHFFAQSRGQKKLQQHPDTSRHKAVPSLCTRLMQSRVGGVRPCSWALLSFPVEFWDFLWFPEGPKRTNWGNLEVTHDPRASFHPFYFPCYWWKSPMRAHTNLYWVNVQMKRKHGFGYWEAKGLDPCSLKLENSPRVPDTQFLYKTLLKTRRIASVVRTCLKSPPRPPITMVTREMLVSTNFSCSSPW